ncbi:MAG: phage tail tape measure protein, partial [Enterococcus sp.]
VGESIQIALLPFFEMAIDALQRFKAWFDSLDEGQKNMIVTFALVAAAIGPLLVVLGTLMGSVTKVAGGIRTLQSVFSAMKIAFATNPFLLVIAGIALLIAGLVLAYNKVKWFHDGVNAFFRGVRDVGVQALRFIGGYVGNVFGGIIANFNNFKNAGMRILNGIVDFITGVFTGNWSRAWQGVTNIFGGIFEGIAAMAKAPINGMIGLINGFLGGLNNIKIPKWVPKVGGKSFNISQIPYLAKGGHLINGDAIMGEAGPELLSVRNGKTTVTPLSDDEKRKGIGGKVGGGTIEQHIHISNVDANNPSELDRLNRKIAKADQQAIYDLGGVPG